MKETGRKRILLTGTVFAYAVRTGGDWMKRLYQFHWENAGAGPEYNSSVEVRS